MPGEKDPTAPTMPQQALHPAMLPNAAVWENFNGRSNPWSFEINGTSYVSTSVFIITGKFADDFGLVET